MNEKMIHHYVGRYLEATNCSIIEKDNNHFIVKLSKEADMALTNRPYYWSFVERADVEPETMSFLFVTNVEEYEQAQADKNAQIEHHNFQSEAAQELGVSPADAALARTMGFVQPTVNVRQFPRENLYFGAAKLEQIFAATNKNGSYVCLFEQPASRSNHPLESTAYTTWLGVNLKIEFISDQKKEDIYSFGVSLITGHCMEDFHSLLLTKKMSMQLPANIHVAKNGINFNRALQIIEQQMERKLKALDYQWAEQATERLEEELQLISTYYDKMLEQTDEEERPAIMEQFEQRKAEIRSQYSPRVTASAINCGLFHLRGID
ncbi:YqhG family protein [Paenibacillus yanchengensis]|uniref:YqhG family protein n=1 Tax=Paenibacillus yanchengensis TaxID=2035833 RepID=A0ABW4YKX1_9BACL